MAMNLTRYCGYNVYSYLLFNTDFLLVQHRKMLKEENNWQSVVLLLLPVTFTWSILHKDIWCSYWKHIHFLWWIIKLNTPSRDYLGNIPLTLRGNVQMEVITEVQTQIGRYWMHDSGWREGKLTSAIHLTTLMVAVCVLGLIYLHRVS